MKDTNDNKIFSPEDFDKPKENSSNWKKPIGIAAIITLLCGAGYGCYTLWNQSNEGVVEEGAVALISPDSDSSPLKKDVTDENEQAKGMQNQNSENVDSENIDENTFPVAPTESSTDETNQPKEEHRTIDAIPSGTLEQKAKQVIRGDFGNGQVRKNKLGSEYETIQNKVNEMYRKGDLFM